MITQGDLGKLNRVFATKEDLLGSEDRVISTIRRLYNEVLDKMDVFITEVRNYRLEQVTHVQRHEDIEKKVREIESVPVIAQELKRTKK